LFPLLRPPQLRLLFLPLCLLRRHLGDLSFFRDLTASGGFRHVTFRGCEEIVMYSATSLQFLDRVWTPFRVKDQDFDRLAVIRNLCGAVCIPATR
jgi:hypothetical protein